MEHICVAYCLSSFFLTANPRRFWRGSLRRSKKWGDRLSHRSRSGRPSIIPWISKKLFAAIWKMDDSGLTTTWRRMPYALWCWVEKTGSSWEVNGEDGPLLCSWDWSNPARTVKSTPGNTSTICSGGLWAIRSIACESYSPTSGNRCLRTIGAWSLRPRPEKHFPLSSCQRTPAAVLTNYRILPHLKTSYNMGSSDGYLFVYTWMYEYFIVMEITLCYTVYE